MTADDHFIEQIDLQITGDVCTTVTICHAHAHEARVLNSGPASIYITLQQPHGLAEHRLLPRNCEARIYPTNSEGAREFDVWMPNLHGHADISVRRTSAAI